MSRKQLNNVRIQHLKDTKANWELYNPVLRKGQMALVTGVDPEDPDTVWIKFGDGSTSFNDLSYFTDQTKIDKILVGVPNGVASLDESGKVPLSQLPASVGGTIIIEDIPEQFGVVVYNGEIQMPVWKNYDPDAFLLSGTISAKDAGEYTAIFQPASGYTWANGTQSPVYCKWIIEKKIIQTLPSLDNNTLTFSGSAQSPDWKNYSSEELEIGGTYSALTVGDYTATFTPKANYMWADGTQTAVEVSWSIAPQVIGIPLQTETLVYNGSSQSPAWSTYDADKMTVSGTLSATNAGTYSVTFTLKAGYVWTGGASAPLTCDWEIEQQVITVIPSIAKELVYNGTSQSPEWKNLIAGSFDIGGDLAGIDAGEYTTTFTPTANYRLSQEILDSLS